MNSHDLKQQVIRNANDAQAQARMVLAKCIAGLAVLVVLALAGTLSGPGDDLARPAAASAGTEPAESNTAKLRRETFEARRAQHDAERRSEEPQKAATR